MLRVLKHLQWMWPARIRYQLICGVALVHLLLMTIFVFDLVGRQREFLKEQSLEATQGLVQTLAVNSVSWVLANDVVGMEEIILSVRQYPGLRYAMVVTSDGQVLAHTDTSCVGKYVNDDISRAMLAAEPKEQTLYRDHALLDIAAPVVTAAGKTVAWARIGQGQEQIWKSLRSASRNGFLYTLLAIAVGSVLAVLIGNHLTSGLNRLLSVSGQIRDGRHDLRMDVCRADEISRLGEGINEMLEAITSGEERFRVLFEQAPDAIFVYDADLNRFLDANTNAERLFGCGRDELLKHGPQRFWPARQPDSGLVSDDWRHDAERALAGNNVVCQQALTSADGRQLHCEVRLSRLPSADHRLLRASYVNITERKRAEEALKRIEWMLSKKHTSVVAEANNGQGYGDLTALNRDGAILKSVGRDVLGNIAADYLDLLGTSSAIYEANGDYAFGIFTSSWCRMLDRASRRLCNTDDNAAALNSGQWSCHESCWTRCSKQAIATRAPVDIECNGGIRLYGVPIFAGDTVIGSINFGYGDIPKDPATLRALAATYHVDYADLLAQCDAYDSRPPYIVEMAKSRLHASARLIGILVERKRAEDAVRRAGAYHRSLIEASLDPLVTIGPDGKVTDVNAATESVTGFTRAELIGTDFSEYFAEPARAQAGYQQVFREGAVRDYPLEILHRDGHVTSVLYNATVYRDDAGQVVGVFAAARDITERKRAEERIAQLAAIVESSDDAIVGKTLDGIVTSWNKGAETIYGYAESEMIGRPVAMLVPSGREDEVPRIIEKIGRGEPIEHYETIRRRKDGQEISLSLTISPVRDTAGTIVGASAIGHDITERKRTESVNMARLRLLQFAATHSLDELLEATLNEAEELTGSRIGFYHFVEADQKTLSLQNWSTRTKAEFCTAEGKGLHYDVSAAGVWVDCVHERRPVIHNDYVSLPHRKGMPPGHAPVVRELVVPVFRGDKIVAILGVGNKPQDYGPEDVETVSLLADLAWEIAERKRAEDEVRQLNMELERRVLDRTAQLEAANKELEAFAYSVSHDLRAPLRHVDGFLELLQKKTAGKLDEQSGHYMVTIADAAKRMGTLIDDLLSFSRMGRSTMATEPVDLGALVRDVIQECKPDVRGRSVNWHIADLPLVTGDRAMLRIVLTNLISNALKFTRPRPQAEIEIGWRTDEDAATVIFVRDNGVGFDMTYADKLFRVFRRLHRADEFEGTGIGLANVRRVIHRHGGKTWAEGHVGQGATFYFSLPLHSLGALP